tara:strand:- start:417 stop:1079 length:663 start_codon:yes stop_codon:yes gene_type:complete
MKDGDHLAVWVYLMLKATHKTYDIVWNGERKSLTAGQLITSRKAIAKDLKVSESKVERILKAFKTEQQIEQLSSSASRCISITKWGSFQATEQPDEQPSDSDRTASGQPANTNKNVETVKNVKEGKKTTQPSKKAYGEFKNIKLTPDELSKLREIHGDSMLMKGINTLGDWMQSTGKTRKNHYACLKASSWVWKRLAEDGHGKDANGGDHYTIPAKEDGT